MADSGRSGQAYLRTHAKTMSQQIGEEGGSMLYSDQTHSTSQERQEGPKCKLNG